MAKVSVLVPYLADGGRREATWTWLRARWEQVAFAMDLDLEVVTGAPADPCPDPGQFNRPQAINAAAAKATGDIFIVNDCDTAFDGWWLRDAITAVEYEGGWVMPQTYLKLSEEVTAGILAGPSDKDPLPTGPVDWQGDTSVSGLLVLPRRAFEDVGGFDERHRGWGWDDISFSTAMWTLFEPYRRLAGYAYHLWHPQPHEHAFGQPTTKAQQALFHRYQAAEGDHAAMRAIIAEDGHG